MIFTFILRFLFTFTLSYINDYQLFKTMTMINLPQNLEILLHLLHCIVIEHQLIVTYTISSKLRTKLIIWTFLWIYFLFKSFKVYWNYALNSSGKIQYNWNEEHNKLLFILTFFGSYSMVMWWYNCCLLTCFVQYFDIPFCTIIIVKFFPDLANVYHGILVDLLLGPVTYY